MWDEAKAESNIVRSRNQFFDPFCLYEDASVDEERRDAAIGLSGDWPALYVVFIEREGSVIRIISARKADPSERELYEES